MSVEIERDVLRDYAQASCLEWLDTDGLGGWAGSTLAGVNTRRDHGLLSVAVRAIEPAGPARVVVAKLEETLFVAGETILLGCNRFSGAVIPRGFEYLASFSRDVFPVFEYEAAGVRLRKTVAMVEGGGTTLVTFEVIAAPSRFVLELRPLLAVREAHGLSRARQFPAPACAWREDVLELGYPAGATLFLAAPAASFLSVPDWWYRFELDGEHEHGVGCEEDLWTPGVLRRELAAGDRFGIVIAAAQPGVIDAWALLESERRRREKALEGLPVHDELARILGLAAGQLVLRRGSGRQTIAAGYPGGEDSTSDTLIALPGVFLAAGRAGEARKLLHAYSRAARDGRLPDRFPGQGEPRFSSADASLWLFPATHHFLAATGDEAFVRDTLLPVLGRIVDGYGNDAAGGGLRVADDGLLESRGQAPPPVKAVELNALWYNALATLANLTARLGDPAQAKALAERARRVQRRFADLFWSSENGCLYDTAGANPSPAFRPHQLLAVGLPFPVLSKARSLRLLAAAEERLYTPAGLREAVPAADPDRSGGIPPGTRAPGAASGEQEIAWPWLLGQFLSGMARLRGAAGRRQALQLLAELDPLLAGGAVGTLPEAALPHPPYTPRGHLAHAASVAEILRVYLTDLRPASPPPARPPRPAGTRSRAKPAAKRRQRSPGRRRGP